MEPQANTPEPKGPGRPKNVTDEMIAVRARLVRSHLMVGRGRKEICELEGITPTEYQVAIRWIGRKWKNNEEAFGDFIIGEQARLEAIQKLINAEDGKGPMADFNVIGKLHKLAHDIRCNTYEMALKLGILDREALKIKDQRQVVSSFGDENVTPWFSDKQLPPPSGEVVDAELVQ